MTAQELTRRRIAWLAVLTFLFMLALAFLPALRAVSGLERGATIDLHRDEAFVHALLEGHYGEDPTYLGGGMWYTPLITWLEAAVTWLTGQPAGQVIVRMGPYANLLGPVAFFLMCAYFLGSVRAVVCTAVYLFFAIGQEPGWVVATYTHRLIPVAFSQWFFYLEVILIDRAFRSDRAGPSALAGLFAGITFLAHAGPAMIAVLIIATFTGHRLFAAWRNGDRRAAWHRMKATALAAVAFTVATLPLTWHLLTGHLQVGNRAGFLFTYYALTWQHVGVLLQHNLDGYTCFALAGIWLAWRLPARTGVTPHARRSLLAWLGITSLLFWYSYAVSLLDTHAGIHLPALLPTFHFYFYTTAALSVFAGLAVTWLIKLAADRAWGLPIPRGPLGRASLFFALITVACTVQYPSYATRRDVFAVRNRDLAFQEDAQGAQAAAFIHAQVPWDGVVLCNTELSMWPMLPTARHVVATASTMGNPYLDQPQREQDRMQLLDAMERPIPGTAALLDKYGVTHLLVHSLDMPRMPEARQWFPHEVFRNEGFVMLAR